MNKRENNPKINKHGDGYNRGNDALKTNVHARPEETVVQEVPKEKHKEHCLHDDYSDDFSI